MLNDQWCIPDIKASLKLMPSVWHLPLGVCCSAPLRTGPDEHLLPGGCRQHPFPCQEGGNPTSTPPSPLCSLTTKGAATIFERLFSGTEGNKLLNRELGWKGRQVFQLFSFLSLLSRVPHQPLRSSSLKPGSQPGHPCPGSGGKCCRV